MSSSLATQLARLQQRPGTDKKLAHSFLFSDSDAKQFSRDQIYELAMAGLAALLRIDNRLHPFLSNIFHKSVVRRERAMLTNAEQTVANTHIEAILSLLSPHMFLTAAQQVVEYLVRVWEVQTYNVPDMLEAFLPYHDHSLFARVLMMLDLRDTGFDSLSKNQLSGAPLLGAQLRMLCGESRKALRSVCSCATKAVKYSVANHAAFALYAGVCSSLAVHPDGEALFRSVLPTLNDFITWSSSSALGGVAGGSSVVVEDVASGADKTNVSGDAVSATVRAESLSASLVVLCAWSQETQFGPRVLSALLKPLLRAMSYSTFPVPLRDAITVLGVLFRSQLAAVGDPSFAPVMRIIVGLPWHDWARLIPVPSPTLPGPSATCEFISALLKYVCAAHLAPAESPDSLPADIRHFLLAAAEHLPLTQDDIHALIRVVAVHRPLHDAFIGDGSASSSSSSTTFRSIFPAIRRRMPMALDHAIVSLLRPSSESPSVNDDAANTFVERYFEISDCSGNEEASSAVEALTAISYKRLDTTSVVGQKKKKPQRSSSSVGATEATSRLPLSVCLMHYLPEVRLIALRELQKVNPAHVIRALGATERSKNTLVEMLLYVVRFETDTSVALLASEVVQSWLSAASAHHNRDANEEDQREHSSVVTTFVASALEALFDAALAHSQNGQQMATGAAGQKPQLLASQSDVVESVVNTLASVGCSKMHHHHAADLARHFLLVLSHSLATIHNNSSESDPTSSRALDFARSALSKAAPETATATNLIVALVQSPALLTAVANTTESARHVQAALTRVIHLEERSAGSGGATSAACAEACVTIAAAVAYRFLGDQEQTDVDHRRRRRAQEVLGAFSNWMDPQNRSGFVSCVRARAQETYAKQLAERGPGAASRGAKATAESEVESAVASHAVSKQLVSAIRAALEVVLPALDRQLILSGSHSRDDDVAVVATLVKALRTLSSLPSSTTSTMLPSWFFAAPTATPRVLLRCLEEPAPFSMEEWRTDAARLLTSLPSSTQPPVNSDYPVRDAITLLLLVQVLCTDEREAVGIAQQLQLLVSEAMAASGSRVGARKGTQISPAASVIHAALAGKCLSATGLSAVIEAIALRFPTAARTAAALPLDAAQVLARWIATCAPASLRMQLIVTFFPSPLQMSTSSPSSSKSTTSQKEERRRANHTILLAEMHPLLVSRLQATQRASKSNTPSLSRAEIEVVEYLLRGITHVDTASSPSSVVEAFLSSFLREFPSVLISESGKEYAPLYREALSALGRIFGEASLLESGNSGAASSLIFTAGSKSPTTNKLQSTPGAVEANKEVAGRLHKLLLSLWSRHGTDVAVYASCTASGMAHLLLPIMKGTMEGSVADSDLFGFVHDALEAKFGSTAATNNSNNVSSIVWPSLEGLRTSAPQLTSHDAVAFISLHCTPLLTGRIPSSATSKKTPILPAARVAALRVTTLLLSSAVALHFPRNEDEDGDDDVLGTSPAQNTSMFVRTVLELVPLSCLESFVGSIGGDKSRTLDGATTVVDHMAASSRNAVVSFAAALAAACVAANDASVEFTALRQSATKELLSLMTAILGGSAGENDEDVREAANSEAAVGTVNFIGRLLTVIAPLLSEETATSGITGGGASSTTSLLHVVVLALMLRLEPLSGTEVLQFRSAVDCCRDIITSFDIDTQMICLSGIMRTVLYPHNPMRRSIDVDEQSSSPPQHDEDMDDDADPVRTKRSIVHRLLRANKIINRQETILQLIVTTLKNDRFLAPFIAQQQRGGRNLKKAATAAQKKNAKEGDVLTGGDDADEAKDAEAHTAHDSCMEMLLTSLGLFAHYHTLNESISVVTHYENKNDDDDAATATVSEDKQYVMLLELLAGNALGCILAGINEPTFVECQKRLLNDSRVALQVKGLEMLVDRLHQAVPTVEDSLTDAEAAQRRRDLRDPRKKLTNYDLLLLKARPLATKRTMILFPLMQHIVAGALRATTKTVGDGAAPHRQLVTLAQLGITAMEELTRTVGSGGSLLSEATLAHGERSLLVTESQVYKLFGSKAKAHEVASFLEMLLKNVIPVQRRITGPVLASGPTDVTDGLAALLASIVTAIATVVQTMGAAFVSPFSNEIMQVMSGALEFSVSQLPGDVARTSVGSLIRVACFNATLRVFSATWLMCAPYLPVILAACCHKTSMSDSESSACATELLQTVKALLEPRVMLECCCTALSGRNGAAVAIRASTHDFAVLFSCIESLLRSLTKRDIAAMPVLVVSDSTERTGNMWIAAMLSLASMPQLPSADEANALFDAFITMLIKFKADDCKRHVATLLTWAFDEQQKRSADDTPQRGGDTSAIIAAHNNNNSKQSLHRMILFLGLYNRMLEKLQSLSAFSFAAVSGALVSTFVRSLRRGGAASVGSDEDEEEQRGSKRRASGIDALSTILLEGALDAVRRMSDAQIPAPDTPVAALTTPYFAEAKVFNALMPPFLQQLSNIQTLTDENRSYDHRVVHTVVPSIRSFFKALASPKLWSSAQAELLKLLRSPKHQVRRAVLRTFRGVYADGGDEMAAMIMSEMLPAVVEATEDTHAEVVEEARLLCNDLSGISGRDVLHAMS